MKPTLLLVLLIAVQLFAGESAPDLKDYKGKAWKDTPQVIPGKLIAAYYDTGGEGVAYHDVDTKNNGSGSLNKGPDEKNNFRKEEAVDVSYTKAAFDKFTDGKLLDIDQYYVGWTSSGEWLNYTVDVKTAGTYTINLLASSNNKSAEISLSVNGADKTGTLVLESTGHWHKWKLYEKLVEIKLDAGPQIITLKFVKEGNMNVQNLEFTLKQ